MVAILTLLAVSTAHVSSAAATGTPQLSAGDLSLSAGETNSLVIQGEIAGQATFGVTVLVELVPRPGAQGTLRFTPAPPVDVVQLGDPWPEAGSFTPFDTDSTSSLVQNGCVDDNGSFVPSETTFAGPLAAFPIIASPSASGVWDIQLSTTVGNSGWEGLTTTLISGTVTVQGGPTVPVLSGGGLAVMIGALLVAGGFVLGTRQPRSQS